MSHAPRNNKYPIGIGHVSSTRVNQEKGRDSAEVNAVMESDVPEGQGTTKKKRRKKLCRSKSLLDRILTFSECRCMDLRATCFAHAGFSFITEPGTVGCDDCGLMLSEFKDNMLDPLVLHHTLRPDCPYVKYINSGSGDGSARSETGEISDIGTNPQSLMSLTSTTSNTSSMMIDREDTSSNESHLHNRYKALCELRHLEHRTRERSKDSVLTANRSDMIYEISRRDTFTNHSIPNSLYVARLAEKGFHFSGSGEDSSLQIRCAFCMLIISITEGIKSQNDVERCHYSLKPYCPFLRGKPSNTDSFYKTDVCGFFIPDEKGEKTKNVPDIYGESMWTSLETAEVTSNPLSDLGVSNTFAKYPLLSVSDNRLSTYLAFPHTYRSSVDTDRLVEAGYFYEGCKDCVTCFYCGCKSSDWSISEDPWKRHARTSPNCQHVISAKGITFIRQTKEELGQYTPPRQENVINNVTTRMIRPRWDTPVTQRARELGLGGDFIKSALISRIKKGERDFRYLEEIVKAVNDMKVPAEHLQQGGSKPIQLPKVVQLCHSRNSESEDEYQQIDAELAIGDSGTESLLNTSGSGIEPAVETNKPPKIDYRDTITQLTCKICFSDPVGVIFLPCGHLACCVRCAPAMVDCPICRKTVNGTIRAHLP